MESIRIENLTFYYPESDIPAIDDFSVSIDSGDFFVLFGHSGCGKSTLLRQLKPQIAPHGTKSGRILFNGTTIDDLTERDSASKIGFVMQSPDNQLVTDKVWHELAFGLESLGYDTPTIRRRIAEIASFFGIQNWFYMDVSELSGGQKQLLNLASVMVMQPSVLIFD
ncbi:MAG: energy-coupling factor ABC transporter ATP-binding protein [Eubacterium sp.]|nr:energy-coupling factor ABC transporter ATP-binding protein [Eubacterium sp.]